MAKNFREDILLTSSATNKSGLQFENMTSSTPTTPAAQPIGVTATGEVVNVDGIIGSDLFTLSDGTTTQVVQGWDTFTITAGNGITATVSATDILTIASKLSTDADNDLSIGTDGWLYLSQNSLLTGVTWDDSTNSLVLAFDSGSTVNVPIVDNVSTFLMDLVISDGTTTDTVNNHETITFAGADLLRPTVTANTVTYDIDTTGATLWQSPEFDGTDVVWWDGKNIYTVDWTLAADRTVTMSNDGSKNITFTSVTWDDDVKLFTDQTSALNWFNSWFEMKWWGSQAWFFAAKTDELWAQAIEDLVLDAANGNYRVFTAPATTTTLNQAIVRDPVTWFLRLRDLSTLSTARYVNTWTPVANVETIHTHALAAGEDIQVQVRDAVSKEIIDVEVRIISATTFGVTSTTTDALHVVWL